MSSLSELQARRHEEASSHTIFLTFDVFNGHLFSKIAAFYGLNEKCPMYFFTKSSCEPCGHEKKKLFRKCFAAEITKEMNRGVAGVENRQPHKARD